MTYLDFERPAEVGLDPSMLSHDDLVKVFVDNHLLRHQCRLPRALDQRLGASVETFVGLHFRVLGQKG